MERGAHCLCAPGSGGLGDRHRPLIPKLREMGLVNLYGVLGLPNPGSEALHRRFGFTRQGLYPRMGFKLGEWHDVAQYGLRLTPPDRPPEPLFRTEGGTQG